MSSVWLDGRLLPSSAAAIACDDRGLLLGDGLFETLRALGGHPMFLGAHLRRLREGAAVLDLPVPAGDEAIARAVARTLGANGLEQGEAAVRITLTRGSGPRGLPPPPDPRPTLLLTAAAYARPRSPAAAVIVRTVRRNEHSPSSRLKSLGALDAVLAWQEVERAGADEGLLRCTGGSLAEGVASNLFLVRRGALATPSLDTGALPGVTRRRVLRAATKLGLDAGERLVVPEELGPADEAFLTSSLIGVRPLVRVDGRVIGDGRTGPLTRRLAAALEGQQEFPGRR